MCELFALSARQPTTVTLSLETFAKRGGLTGPHEDGWGIAYYQDGDVLLVRDADRASASPWVEFVEAQAPASRTVIAHVRQANRGAVGLRNTHPFQRELGGTRHVFAHNGALDGVEAFYDRRGARFRPVGETDSELAFCVLMQRMADIWLGEAAPSRQDRAEVFRAFADDMRALGSANFLYSDGECLFAHGHRRDPGDGTSRPPGLHMLARSCPVDADPLSADGITVGGKGQKVVLFASVPLTDEAWRPLEEGEVVTVGNGEACAVETP